MQRQRPESFYVREVILGLYFRGDDPKRYRLIREATGFKFFSEPGAYEEYGGWCVVPFREGDPKGIEWVGDLVPHMPGSLSRNPNGQAVGGTDFLRYDPTSERFSRYIFAVRDEDVPITERHKDVSDRRHFVFDI